MLSSVYQAVDFHRRESKVAREFVECYLRRDGLFLVRLVAKNSGALVAAELLHGLWTNYGPQRHRLANCSGASSADHHHAARPPPTALNAQDIV